MTTAFKYVIVFLLTFSLNAYSQIDPQSHECFMVLVGREASSDGSVLIAHNNDLTGTESSFIQKIPKQTHSDDEYFSFPTGLKIKQAKKTYEWIVLQIEKGYAEGDAIAVNQFGVAIGGGVALGKDRNKPAAEADPLNKKGLTGGVRYLALERSKTARQCVELMGALYSKYGVSYPAGVAVADPNEIWYIEAGGGYTWAAVRIPDDSFMVIANGYRIGKIDPFDTLNVITSPALLRFAEENNLWNPELGEFNFAKAFGGGRENRFYDTRRVWRGVSLLSSDKYNSDDLEFPIFIKPDKKIDVRNLFTLLRDRYEGTPFEKDNSERMICIERAVHSSVVQLRNWLPAETGNILWAALSVPATSVYVPFYFGIGEVNSYFGNSSKDNSAFWKFKKLYDSTLLNRELFYKTRTDFYTIENKIFHIQKETEHDALNHFECRRNNGIEFLTYYVNGLCDIVINKTESLLHCGK